MTQQDRQGAGAIQRIEIEGLFGAYDYRLPVSSGGRNSLGDVVILYGDNGSGKTTILSLVFHILSAADHRGHRNAIARVPFRRFLVLLRDGTEIVASRSEAAAGTYTMALSRGGSPISSLTFDPDEEKRPLDQRPLRELLASLDNLGLHLYLLSDDRELLSDTLPSEDVDHEMLYGARLRRRLDLLRVARQRSLLDAAERTHQWISRRVVTASRIGSVNADTIYTQIVERIARGTGSETALPRPSSEEMVRTLEELAEHSKRYSKFRFSTEMEVGEIVNHLRSAGHDTQQIICEILDPYIKGAKARLEALSSIQRLTETFVGNFNNFYVDKTVTYDLAEGLRVNSKTGDPISPELLSSGERQLLLLFCYTLISSDRQSVFIIDEPELSLNVKWQRRLVDALTSIVEGSNNQFIFATHSIEFLTKHRANVVRLAQQPVCFKSSYKRNPA